MPVKILISGAGAASTIAIIRTLKSIGRYEITTFDAVRYSIGLKFADSGYVVPFGSAPNFKRALREVVQRERPDYLIPLIDEEIAAFHETADLLGGRVIAPRPAFCRMAFDKWSTYESLSAAGIPMPRTTLATVDAASVRYPAVVKPRSSTGSRGVAYLEEPSDLKRYLQTSAGSAGSYIVQERLRGKEYSVSAVVGLGGPVLAVVPKESIIKRGMSLVAVTRRFPQIDEMCRTIQEQFRPDGPFNLQLFVTKEGQPYILEINPRFSGSIPLTIAAGVNEPDLIIRHAEGEHVGPIDFTPDLMMLRYHVDEYLPESEWETLLDGRDLREIV
jgi:carbamoyl-phosphate synthase large subunit